jgi:tetratricopeptide (TPR) repeat protein
MLKCLKKLNSGWPVAAALVLGVSAPAAAAPLSPTAFLALVEQAEAMTAAKDWKQAAALWQRAAAANPTEGRYWSQLGNAHARLGDHRRAIPALEKAVELGYGAPENNAYNIAVAYGHLGDTENALRWLEKAYAMQFILFDLPAKEEALKFLHSEPRFQALVPIADTTKMSREEGWRYDLAHLEREIDRLGEAPYRVKSKADFQRDFAALAAEVPRLTDPQIVLRVGRLVREVGDGHSSALGSLGPETSLSLPVQFYAFEDGVHIVAADPRHRGLLGARLLGMDGRGIETLFEGVKPYVSRDNEGRWTELQTSERLRNTGLLKAFGLVDDARRVSLRLRMTDGKLRTVAVEADSPLFDIWNIKPHPPQWARFIESAPGPLPLYLRDPGKNYWFEFLPKERTVYFAFNRIRDDPAEPLAAFARRLENFIAANPVDKLVIDMRWNNGGGAHLMPALIASLLRSEKVNRESRLFVIIGRRVFSAAQVAAAMLDRFTNATFIGEPTGSSPNFIGEEDSFILPYSKMRVNISHLAWQGSIPQDRRVWMAPLIYTPPTFADYRVNRDPALEAALAFPLRD